MAPESEVLVNAGAQPSYTTQVTVVNQPVEAPGVAITRKVVNVTVRRVDDSDELPDIDFVLIYETAKL